MASDAGRMLKTRRGRKVASAAANDAPAVIEASAWTPQPDAEPSAADAIEALVADMRQEAEAAADASAAEAPPVEAAVVDVIGAVALPAEPAALLGVAADATPAAATLYPTPQAEDPTMLDTDTAAGAAATPTLNTAGATAAVSQMQTDMAAKATQMMERSMKTMTDMTEFAKGNVEAMIASAKAATAGAETIMTTVTEHGRKQYEAGTTAARAMTAAKTPAELMQLQNDWLKGQFDHGVAMWSQMSETMLKVAGDVAQPLSSRMALATDQMKAVMAR